jgi:hypothetical protein
MRITRILLCFISLLSLSGFIRAGSQYTGTQNNPQLWDIYVQPRGYNYNAQISVYDNFGDSGKGLDLLGYFNVGGGDNGIFISINGDWTNNKLEIRTYGKNIYFNNYSGYPEKHAESNGYQYYTIIVPWTNNSIGGPFHSQACDAYEYWEDELWKPFDEASGDWYVYQDWQPVDDGHMRRVEHQDWRKGERCVGGTSLGQERNVISYYKERDEIEPKPVEPKWVEYDDLIRDWYDVGDWTPAAATIPYGQVFTQTKVQKQDREKGERCTDGPQKGATRDEKPYTKENIVTRENTGTKEQWEAFNILVRDWYDTSGWTPDADTVLAGEAFTQTKQQAQDWRSGEWCVLGPVPGAERNVEDHKKTRSQTQPAVGTMEVWGPVYWWSEWYPVSEWTPDAGMYLTTQTFEQTIRLKRGQYMKEISNIGNVRKDNTYIQSEYKSESRVVQGIKQPEANISISTKAPEIEIQSNSTKGTGQYYIIPD